MDYMDLLLLGFHLLLEIKMKSLNEPAPTLLAVVALNKQEPHSGASHLIPSPIPHIENDNWLIMTWLEE